MQFHKLYNDMQFHKLYNLYQLKRPQNIAVISVMICNSISCTTCTSWKAPFSQLYHNLAVMSVMRCNFISCTTCTSWKGPLLTTAPQHCVCNKRYTFTSCMAWVVWVKRAPSSQLHHNKTVSVYNEIQFHQGATCKICAMNHTTWQDPILKVHKNSWSLLWDVIPVKYKNQLHLIPLKSTYFTKLSNQQKQ